MNDSNLMEYMHKDIWSGVSQIQIQNPDSSGISDEDSSVFSGYTNFSRVSS